MSNHAHTEGLPDVLSAPHPGPADVKVVVAYGFWIFLLSDIIMFSALFATYAVLHTQTAGGPAPRDVFELKGVAVETLALLFSSYTCGLAIIFSTRKSLALFYIMMAATFVLGAVFLGLEISEFVRMVGAQAGPSRSAFLSAFFALVGLHGAHISVGLLWLVFLSAGFAVKGARPFLQRRLRCFGLYWHALDIIWVSLLSLVYLMGVQ